MRVVIDSKEMTAVGTGLARYERELARRLTAAVDATTIVRRQAVADGAAASLTGRVVTVPDRLPSIVVEQVVVPAVALWRRADVLHAMAGNAPLVPLPGRLVITFHEDRTEYYRDHPPQGRYARLAAKWQTWSGRVALRRADTVLTVSETSAVVARRLAGRRAEDVVAVPHGVSEAFRFEAPAEETERFVLALASGDPRDDLALAIEGLAPLADRLELVVAGSVPPADRQSLEAAAGRVDLRLRFPGRVTDEELADLYHRCLCYLHLSSFEGFGLAVAEAMACGAVVIGRPSAAFEEVAGQAGLTVTTAEELAACVRSFFGDMPGGRRMAALSLARARLFTWEDAFDRTLAAYAVPPRRTLSARGTR